MTELTDEELHQRGQEAEDFMRSCQEGSQYFLNLMSEIEAEVKNNILSLKPEYQEMFTIYKAQLDGLTVPMMRVIQDIEAGKQAWNRINGIVDETQGIL